MIFPVYIQEIYLVLWHVLYTGFAQECYRKCDMFCIEGKKGAYRNHMAFTVHKSSQEIWHQCVCVLCLFV